MFEDDGYSVGIPLIDLFFLILICGVLYLVLSNVLGYYTSFMSGFNDIEKGETDNALSFVTDAFNQFIPTVSVLAVGIVLLIILQVVSGLFR